ncbi:Vesicle-mediated ER to Golgi transport protein [Paecilomyces lecythidis]|uniref:Vesicle-mediated ER to Golgi transport protein n=1 Tax=Paecilomyces lecythidis TaxID=3004212 RepID=A0ABR3Y541_9EURO
MFRILESQAPAKQTATDTISTLSSRLQSATLLEDRRAAILGLRSFAKIYPASVASGALRALISSLRNDGEDVDTVKVVLETLLMLFSPDENSPEASDEIALWLADEFTQRQDNITALLDLLDNRDFYSRLYSLQLISHICGARPERTQECIFTAPLGISRLVSMLSDVREPVRNEALVLLIALTPSSPELQKVVAFENAFERAFSLIEAEGGLTHGSEVVEDCLSLLANLLKLNVSNQSYFRETGCVKRLTKLLADAIEPQEDEDVPPWILAHRDKNIWGLLAIVQLFLVRGGVSTPASQLAFWQSGLMEQALRTAFSQDFDVRITAKALATSADLIRGNPGLQEKFADVDVTWGSQPRVPSQANGDSKIHELPRINVIEALLKLTLEPAPVNVLDARLAAGECMKAFFEKHSGIRHHVLRRAIDGHLSGNDQIPNILSVLVEPPESRGNADPYQTWLASVLMFHLLFEDPEAKAIAMKVTEGDAESGEEVVTCVQTILGNMITGMQRGDDERITVGYLMLLCGWLFEDPDAVNDFLGEGSSIQSLIQDIKQRGISSSLVPGLCSVLLGIIYEFSTKDSPIPRKTLHDLLVNRLGREQYIDKITKLRELPLVRDFEVLPQTSQGAYDGLPEIFFDRTFIEFLKDNFSRLLRAIDRDPGFEVPIIANGIQKGISRELVDDLRAQVEDRTRAVQQLESDLLDLQRKLEQEHLDHRRTKDSTALELARIKQINETLQRNHEKELSKLDEQHKHATNELIKQHGQQLRAVEDDLKRASVEHERRSADLNAQYETEATSLKNTIRSLESKLADITQRSATDVDSLKQTINGLESRLADVTQRSAAENDSLRKTIQTLEGDLAKAKEDHERELKAAYEEHSSKNSKLGEQAQSADQRAKKAEERAQQAENQAKNANEKAEKAEKRAQDAEKQVKAANDKAQKAEERARKAEEQKKSAGKGADDTEKRIAKVQEQLKEVQAALEKAKAEAEEKEKARESAQVELEDLLIVFGDLEAKRKQDKKRLKELGEEVSEDEDDEEDQEGDDEDDEDVD